MILCLIRHGETVYNIDERMQGVRDIDLSPRGREEAILLGSRLRESGLHPRRVYSSPVKRAIETARLLGYPAPIIPLNGFKARALGELEGLTRTEIALKYPGAWAKLRHWDWVPPGAHESLRDLFRRATKEMPDILQREQEAGLTLVVTHSGVLEAVVRGWLSLEPHQELPFPLKNAGALLFHENGQGAWIPEKTIAVGKNETVDYA